MSRQLNDLLRLSRVFSLALPTDFRYIYMGTVDGW